ncbi:retinol dehydrogenase 11-like [Pectinophora gossypiella]|uniref:retinol dehydrogenase 11-like n=1 Tax=Pectinophora gossypiella TaxID=13191 RepID=UPI00214E261C|nr:retinol dehydrogenase 11-like [Pectinophora gossypiella]
MSAILLVVIVTLVILLLAAIFGLYQKNYNVLCKSKKRLDGRTVLITGGTSGMGIEIATDLAARGARVIIACPFREEGERAREAIVEESGNDNVVFKLLDLACLDSVRKFAANILNTEQRLDRLLNNAGVGIPGDFQTADGLNFIMQVNYFGHFLLTLLLLPLLRKTGTPTEKSRIINTSSILHRIGRVDIENMNKVGHYWSKIQIYGNSKICLVLFSRELTRRLKEIEANVVINSLDPGAVGTRIFDQCGWMRGHLITFFYGWFCKSPFEGAQTAIHMALDDKAGNVSGEFFKDCDLYPAAGSACNDVTAKELWDASVRLVNMSDDEIRQSFKPL